MTSLLLPSSSLCSAVATSLSSRVRFGLVGTKLFLTVSITPRTSGSVMPLAPLVTSTSRAKATVAAEGCCAFAATGPRQAQIMAPMKTMGESELLYMCMLPDVAGLNPVGLDHPHPSRPGDDGRRYQANEKPVFHHARNCRKPRRQRFGVGNALKRGIEHVVPAIRDERMSLLRAPLDRRSGTGGGHGCGLDGPARGRKAERHHLDRQRKMPQLRHPFGIVGNHDHAGGGGGHDLFPQQRAAPDLPVI